MNKVLVIDNYDSFTYNLVHLIKEMNYDVTVVRNDKFDLDDVSKFDKILLSPWIYFCEMWSKCSFLEIFPLYKIILRI